MMDNLNIRSSVGVCGEHASLTSYGPGMTMLVMLLIVVQFAISVKLLQM